MMYRLGSDKGKYADFYFCSTRKEIISCAQINIELLTICITVLSTHLYNRSISSLINVLLDTNYVQIFNTISWVLWSKKWFEF
jgi:hypothetical protein